MKIEDMVPTVDDIKEMGVDSNSDDVYYDTLNAVAEDLAMHGLYVPDISNYVVADDIEKRHVRKYRPRRYRPWWARNYNSGHISIGDQKIAVKKISADEVSAFYYDLMTLFDKSDTNAKTSVMAMQEYLLTTKYSFEIFKWFRAVREKAELTYNGFMQTTEGLLIDRVQPWDYDKTSFLSTLSAGANDVIGTSASPMQLGNQQGLAIFGHVDDIVTQGQRSPVISATIEKNKVPYPARTLSFIEDEGVKDNMGIFMFVPKDKVSLSVYADSAKDSAYHPLAVVLIPTSLAEAGSNRIKA